MCDTGNAGRTWLAGDGAMPPVALLASGGGAESAADATAVLAVHSSSAFG